MNNIKPDVNSNLLSLGTILQYIQDYGVWNICKSIMILFVFVMTLRICYNPDFLLEKYKEYSEITHQNAQYDRIVNDDKINRILPSIMVDSRASRTWIIQYHNGTSDWSYGSMRFELCLSNVKSIQEQYNDFHLSWLRLPMYLRSNEYFIGDLEDIAKIDHIVYDKFVMNNIKYSACMIIRSNGYDIGILGLTWEEIPDISKDEIRKLLEKYVYKLEGLMHPQIKNYANT